MAVIKIPKGATLSGLATQYGTNIQNLLKLNPQITDPNRIFAGANLNLPDAQTGANIQDLLNKGKDLLNRGNQFLQSGQQFLPKTDTTQMINTEMLNSGQLPFNVEDKSNEQIQNILNLVQKQLESQKTDQVSILDILRQQEETLGIPKLTSERQTFEKQQLGLQQEQTRALEETEERPLTGTFLTEALNRELSNIKAGRTVESLPRLRALTFAGQQAGLLGQQEAQAREEARFRTGLLQTERAGKSPKALLDLATSVFGLKKTQAEIEALGKKETKLDTQIAEVGGRQVLVNKQTGEVIRDLGVATTPGQKEPTQSQFLASGYANRVVFSNNIFDELEGKLASMSGVALKSQFLAPNLIKSDVVRQYKQSADNFINAVLRRESGAAIAASEYETAFNQYLIQPGDDSGTIKQKQINRQLVENSLIAEAGGAYKPSSLTDFPGIKETKKLEPGTIIKKGNVLYSVGADGETLTPVASAQ